ncbi:unnamed protein product, partial [Prunus brigantina]
KVRVKEHKKRALLLLPQVRSAASSSSQANHCCISQCICCIVRHVYCLRHADNPFKASLLPAIFLLGLGCSKLSNNRRNANTTDNNILRKPLDSGEPLGCTGLPLYTLALFMLFTIWVAMKIYRTVFTANRAASFPGQSTFSSFLFCNLFENQFWIFRTQESLVISSHQRRLFMFKITRTPLENSSR